MKPAPARIGGAVVICYTPIDQRHKITGRTKHTVNGVLQGPASGLAICHHEGEDSFYLFGCDEEWNSVTDTWHETLEQAKGQAEFEYQGTAETWIYP